MADSSIHDHSIFISGPSFQVELPAIDALFPVRYARRLFIFRCETPEQRKAQLTALKTGLQALVSHYPILGGIIDPLSDTVDRDGRQAWQNIVPGPGIELVVRDLQTALPSFQELEAANFPPTELPYHSLMPIPYNFSGGRPYAACKFQFSAICGGTIITMTQSHSIADGSGNNELTRVLAEETCFAQKSEGAGTANGIHSMASDIAISLDRSVLRNIRSEIPFNIEDHPGFVWNTTPSSNDSLQGNSVPHPFEAASPEIPVIFRISKTKLAELKADATQVDAPPISTHDALSALMWRSVLLVRSRRSAAARNLPPSTEGTIFMPSDVRRHMNLPPSYVGNVVYQLAATLDLETLFSSSGLQKAASVVRRAITAVSPAIASSYMAKVNERWLDWAFLSSYSTTGMGMGSDWKGALYEMDWGNAFGPLVRYRYPGEPFNCVFPKLPNGDAEVTLSVMSNEVELLKSDECLGKYIV